MVRDWSVNWKGGVMKMAKLKRMLTHPRKNESGQGVLAMVLLLLMLGAIILTPLLVFMQTGVKAGRVYESKLQEFYAADAGVEDAIWEINNGTSGAAYFLGEEVNDRNVSVTIEPISGGGYSGYKIISNATSNSGGNTTIECYYGALDYSSLLDNAITTNDTLKLQPGINVTGNISTPNCEDVDNCYYAGCPNWTCCVYLNCTNCCSNESLSWPTAETLSEYYWDKVKNSTSLGSDIDVSSTPNIARGYENGTLTIHSSKKDKIATLNGTVYVTEDLNIGHQTGGKDFTLNLSKQTIFCEGGIQVGGKCIITGSGCIIAVGDVEFKPKRTVGSEGDFIFIMSLEDTVTLQPNGDFYGSVAGDVNVELYPGGNITWTSYEDKGIDFPIGQSMMKVLSYTIR